MGDTGWGSTPPALPGGAGAMEEQEQTPPFPRTAGMSVQTSQLTTSRMLSLFPRDKILIPPTSRPGKSLSQPPPRGGLAGNATGSGALLAASTPLPSRQGQKRIPD